MMHLNPNQHLKQSKYPYIFLGLYLAFLMSTVCLASKIVSVGQLLLPGGIFAFVFTFLICDIVGEVYGYAYPRLFIWVGVLVEFLFSILVISVSHMPSPSFFKHPEAYERVFDPTFRYVVSGLVGLIVGEFTNIYLLAKWKIMFRGRFFILRSLFSTAFGQGLLTIIVDVLNYAGKFSLSHLSWMMASGYAWKMGFSVILAFPAWLIVQWLKKVEQVSYFDLHTNFNPFMLSLETGRHELNMDIQAEECPT